ncbi:hypothetical protein [Azospirillum argentinense]|nr:hypothetical protein [Azospirillum argentinense]
MAHHVVDIPEDLAQALLDFRRAVGGKSSPDTLLRALEIGAALLPHAEGGAVTVRRPDGTEHRIVLPRDHRVRLAAGNQDLKNRHRGERCFILGAGPSLTGLDLRRLAGETVISVSRTYDLPDFSLIRPRYHCFPTFTRTVMSADDIADLFTAMDPYLGDAELLLSAEEAEIVQRHGLFPKRKVRYLALDPAGILPPPPRLPDLTELLPNVQSVPIMALMIAMYMGFHNIHLLGCDHDEIWSGIYKYAFTPSFTINDPSVDTERRVITSTHDLLQNYSLLWRQYRQCRLIAEANGMRITNATAGGRLDEFERVAYESLFADV